MEVCHRNRIALSNSAGQKCAPMQVAKQSEHGRTISKKLTILSGNRKKQPNSVIWHKKVMSEKNQGSRYKEEGGGSRNSFAG